MPQRRFFQRFWRRNRPPWHKLPDDAPLVVAVATGLQVDDQLLPAGAAIPRDRFQERQLRTLYDWRRIDVASRVDPLPTPAPEPDPEPDVPVLDLTAIQDLADNKRTVPIRPPISGR